MKWTTEKPTKPGWYWIIKKHAPSIVEVHGFSGCLAVYGHRINEPLNSDRFDTALWAGPIPEPTD